MKKVIFIGLLVMGLNLSMSAQNLRFWTENKSEGENYIVTVYAGHMKEGGDTELLKGLNLRYYYESGELQYQSFALSTSLLDVGFQNFGGQGTNGFRADDETRHGTADRFVGHSPFVFDNGLEIHAGDRVPIGTMTFQKKPGLSDADIDAYMIGAKLFRAMTYTSLPGCTGGCPVIVTTPPGPSQQSDVIDLEVVKYGVAHGHLTWAIETPEDIRSYIVERKVGEGDWAKLADLKADGQYVNVYVDENAYDGVKLQQTVSYRIRVNAVNGERMSDIENLDFSAQKMFVDVYPNPASDKVQLTMTPTETKGEAFIEIYGTDGRLVYRNAILPGSVKEQIDLASANVDSGSYTVHLVTSEEILDVRSLHVMR